MLLTDEFLTSWGEFSIVDPITLLLSGGGDSVALFYLLLDSGIGFECLHFRHDGQSEFSSLSEEFCRRLCRDHQVKLDVAEVAGRALVEEGDLSWEAACRTLRYEALKGREGTFLTAHTQDDQAETVLLKLLDGSGLPGLSVIARRREDGVIRPLLGISRARLREFLSQRKAEWLEDPTNSGGNERAKVRHRLLPFLEREWPHLSRTLARTAGRLAEDERYLREVAESWLRTHRGPGGDNWSLADFRELSRPIAFRVLKLIGKRMGRSTHRPRASLYTECLKIIERGGNDSWVEFPGGWGLGVLGERVWVRPDLKHPVWECDPLRGESAPAFVVVSRSPVVGAEAWRVPPGAKLRNRLPGDRFRGKSVKKALAAGKEPPWVRDRVPLLVQNGEVLAVWGVPGRTAPEQGEVVWVGFDSSSLRRSAFPVNRDR